MSGAVFSWRGVRDDKELELVGRYLAPASVPDLKCWQLQLPDNVQFLSAAYELLSRLGFEAVWDTTEDTLESWECAALGSAIRLEECVPIMELPVSAFTWFYEFVASGVGPLITSVNSACWFYTYTRQQSATGSDVYVFGAQLQPGFYRVRLYCYTKSNAGKVDVEFVGGDTIAAVDLYTATGMAQILEYNDVELTAEDGAIGIIISVVGKNPLSSGYEIPLTAISLLKIHE